MSVILTDMEMPSGCWCCEFGATWDNESSLCKRKPTESPVEKYKERPLWCPLKEQEAVKPTWTCGKPFCGVCGLWIPGGKFCSACGRQIAWEGR